MPTEAALEAAYRFFGNERVTFEKLLAPHLDATAERVKAAGQVVVVHDTSEFRFGGATARKGLGDVGNQGQGFFGHFALAVTGDRQPLGVAGVSILLREPGRIRRTGAVDYAKRGGLDRESAKWSELILGVQEV